MAFPAYIYSKLFDAIRALPYSYLPFPPDIHFKTFFYGGPVVTGHFYLETGLLHDKASPKMSKEDWQRLCNYVQDQNYSDLTFYNAYYKVQECYEGHLPSMEELDTFNTKYKNKTTEQLYLEAKELEEWIVDDPSKNPDIIAISNCRITSANRIKLQKALEEFQTKKAERSPEIIDMWKSKVIRYRLAIFQRSILEFLNEPLKMLRVCWHLAIAAFNVKAAEYDEKKPEVTSKTRHKNHNKFRREFKLYEVHLFENAEHLDQYIRTKVFKYNKFDIHRVPTSKIDTREQYLQRKRREQEREEKIRKEREEDQQIADILGMTLAEYQDFRDKEIEKSDERKKEKQD